MTCCQMSQFLLALSLISLSQGLPLATNDLEQAVTEDRTLTKDTTGCDMPPCGVRLFHRNPKCVPNCEAKDGGKGRWEEVSWTVGETVTVPCGKCFRLTATDHAGAPTASLKGLIVHGVLRIEPALAETTVTIEADYVAVTGRLSIGYADNVLRSDVVFELRTTAPSFDQRTSSTDILHDVAKTIKNYTIDTGDSRGSEVISELAFVATLGGKLEMYGFPGGPTDKAWTRLSKTAHIGESQLTMNAAGHTSWPVGSEVVIGSSDFDGGNSEKFTVISASTSGTASTSTLTLDAPLAHRHWGTALSFGDFTVPQVAAEVGLLTRKIKIKGPLSSDKTGLGGHMAVLHSSTPQVIDGVELVRMGQQGIKGRYAFHLHMNREQPETTVTRMSIRDSYQRCIVIHGTNSALIQGNVMHRNVGHCIMLEDGWERKNRIVDNLIVSLLPPARLPDNVGGVGPDGVGHQMSDDEAFEAASGKATKQCESCEEDDYEPSGIWLGHPDNTMRGNSFVGICDCSPCSTFDDSHPIYACRQCQPQNRLMWTNTVWPGIKTSINQCSGVWFKTTGRPRGDSKGHASKGRPGLPRANSIDRENDGGLVSEDNVVHSGGIGFRYYRPAWRPSINLTSIVESGQVLYKLFQAMHVRKNRNIIFKDYRLLDNRVGYGLDQDERISLKDSLVVCRSALSTDDAQQCEKNRGGLMIGGQVAKEAAVGISYGWNGYLPKQPFVGEVWGLPNALQGVTIASCPASCTSPEGEELPMYGIYAPKDPRKTGEPLKNPEDLLDGIKTLAAGGDALYPVKNLMYLYHPELDPEVIITSYGANFSIFRTVNSPQLFGGTNDPTNKDRSGSWLVSTTHPQLAALQSAGVCPSQANSGTNNLISGAMPCAAATEGSWASAPLCFRGLQVAVKPGAAPVAAVYAILEWKLDSSSQPIKQVMAGSGTAYWKDSPKGELWAAFTVVGGVGDRGTYTLKFEDKDGLSLTAEQLNVTLFETKTNSKALGVEQVPTDAARLAADCPLSLTIAPVVAHSIISATTYVPDHYPCAMGVGRYPCSPPIEKATRCLSGLCSTLNDGSYSCPNWAAGKIHVGQTAVPCS